MKLIDLRGNLTDRAVAQQLPRPEIDTNAAVEVVKPILHRVHHEGSEALYDFASRFDKVTPPSILVPKSVLEESLIQLDPAVRFALETAISNTRSAHESQLPIPASTEVISGGFVYQRWVPLRRVGLYVPGGLAVYPSSVVMNVVTAQVAGVDSIVVASPPQKEFGGLPHPTILAACALLGVDEVIAVGGAQAIGAMAYGFTDNSYTCRPVDKVAGPGNVYVAAAKRCVQNVCGIDAEAGTTEIAILADEYANPEYVAADLISQAEHDPAAASVLVTDSPSLATSVNEVLPAMVAATFHSERVSTALNGPQSGIVLVDDLEKGEHVIETYSPEHLEILTTDANERAFRIRNAGAIFVGPYSPVPLGDYMAGSNHVLPTGGTARYASGLNVTQYLRSVQVIDYDEKALANIAKPLVALAESEGLPAHGNSVVIRQKISQESGASSLCQESVNALVQIPFRQELSGIEPYGAPQLEVKARLNVNENPFPPTEEVIDSVVDSVRLALKKLNRYADRDATQLRLDLIKYLAIESGVTPDLSQIWAANGSNEVMLQLLQAFGGPGRCVMAIAPTYSMYEEYARDTNTTWKQLESSVYDGIFPLVSATDVISGLKKHRPAVLFLPSPNNPTGTPLALSTIQKVLDVAKTTGPFDQSGRPTSTLVVIDEAYAEFRSSDMPSAITLLAENPHLVVTRTMSKAFAAAGLRLGYVVADSSIINEIQKVRLPYHLSLVTQATAIAALSHADSQMAQISMLRDERDKLANWLTDNGYQVADSASNFLLFGPLKDREAVWQGLLDRGVLIRIVGPAGCLRVTVGTPEENEMFKRALVEVTQ